MYKTELIREYIKENGISKAEFCRRCGIGVKSLERVLKGCNVRVTVLIKIKGVLQVLLADLFV